MVNLNNVSQDAQSVLGGHVGRKGKKSHKHYL